MHRSGRQCFWLRLAVIAAAAAFVNAHTAYAPATEREEAACGAFAGLFAAPPSEMPGEEAPSDSKQDSDRRSGEDRSSGSGSAFIALRPEVQDQNGASIRRLCPREPVSGLHQPVIPPQAAQHLTLAFEAARPAEPDWLRKAARPIVRHGPPTA